MAQIKVAVVGTGGIARQHGLALTENTNAEIVAAVDTDRARRERFAARCGGEPFDRLDPALERCDAVYVLTPPGFRRQYAVQAITAGKPGLGGRWPQGATSIPRHPAIRPHG